MSKIILAGVIISMAINFGFFAFNMRLGIVLDELRSIRKLLEQLQEKEKPTINLKK